MTQSTRQQTYEVHLASDVAEDLGVDSPVETDHIDYYDSGIWVAVEAGRDFYPYGHVLAIRERPATREPARSAGEAGDEEPTGGAEGAGDETVAQSGEATD